MHEPTEAQEEGSVRVSSQRAVGVGRRLGAPLSSG